MSAAAAPAAFGGGATGAVEGTGAVERFSLSLEALGELTAVGRPGGQGRAYRPGHTPPALAGARVVVKVYRRPPSPEAARLILEMIAWSRSLDSHERERLDAVTAWPLALATRAGRPVGIVMHDLSGTFEVPFVMPSGRRQPVLLSLEHLLGADDFLALRGLGVVLDTTTRALVAERISGALAFLHRHGIVASDIAPNNLLVGFSAGSPRACFIDCDSMVFRGRQALPAVETADWQIPPEFSEPPRTRAADGYKLGLVVMRLFARSHDARAADPHLRRVPLELHALLVRALGKDPANRPAAGEWQRALAQVLIQGGLNARYPGPVPAAPRPVSAPRRDAPTTSPAPAPAPMRVPAPHAARSSRRQRPLSLALFVVTAVVFMLILARLVTATTPSFGGGSGFTPSGGGQAPYYDAPSGGDFH